MTKDLADSLARDHFSWFMGLVKKRFGRSAEEHAGSAFMRVLKYYDPVKGDFRAFASHAVDNAVRSEFSADHGRVDSRKRVAESTKSPIVDDKQAAVDDQVEIAHILRGVDESYENLRKRSAAVLKVLGLFDDGDVAHILNRRSVRGAI